MTDPLSSAQVETTASDQAYFWSSVWQSGIRESRAALERGDFREFDNGTDLARWLLEDDRP